MYFKKIEMHGFKSFAEPVTIEFSDGITCIVGPNGSGKSNISDAIRWVLGEQSPKMLRGGKMEEIIFSGTSSRKSRGMAEVTLVIDNSDESLPIDYKEVAITRRMFRSGESEYHINGSQCRLRDIRELIMDTGIGVDGYSIIGQGKISDILSNKTESRREIFEEAAGIVMYRAKKAESERKLESTSANMDRVQDIIGEIESRIGGLKEESVKAKEYLKLKKLYRELEVNIILKNIENIESKNEYIKDDIAELKGKIDELKDIKVSLEAQVSQNNERNRVLESILKETQESLINTIAELNETVNKGELDKERLSAISDNTVRLEDEIKQLRQKLNSEEKNREELDARDKETDERLEELRRNLEEKQHIYSEMSEEMAALMAKADKYKNDIFEISSSISSDKAEIRSLQVLQETLEKRRETLISEKHTGAGSNKESLDRFNNIKNEKQRINQLLESAKESFSEKTLYFNKARADEEEISKKFEEIRFSLSQLSARKRTIEEMESNYEGYSYAVKHVMKAGLKGIHGVVADLIKVPGGYETAIETAMGAALQNIVCEDDDSAKSAIRYLKINKAGRMTFLPVSSIKGRSSYDNKIKAEKGFIGFGPNCIDFDRKYVNIIEYLLGRVVLVDNMDNAVKMSKKSNGFRYVTLDGEVINAGGAITGGKYKNKTANILDRKAEISNLEKQISENSRIRDELGKRLESLRSSIGEYDTELKSVQKQIREYEIALLEKNNELNLTENLLKDIKNNTQRLEKELSSIDEEKKTSFEMIDVIKTRMDKGRLSMEEAELLSEESIEKYNAKKEIFDKISEEITKARITLNSCEQDKSHALLMKKRIDDSIKEMREQIEHKKDEVAALDEERDKIIHENGKVLIAELSGKKERLEAYLAELNEEKAGLSRDLIKTNEEKEALSDNLEKLHNQKYEFEIKNTKNETQLETYKNRLWEDFEISYIQAMEFKNDDFVMSSAVRENKQIKAKIKELGDVNVGAIEEYDIVKERYDFLTGQKADIQESVDSLNSIISDMDRTIKEKFKESFDKIVVNFEEKFQELFGGGHAELRLSDESNPLESSIDIVAQPPGKKLQNINLLSGGEKTLTAIALMFAVLKVKPTPFCILDEVEAALDDANIDRFINCLRKLSGIQFALVTHQKATMEHADILYGVTMPEKGVSKVLSLNMNDDFDI